MLCYTRVVCRVVLVLLATLLIASSALSASSSNTAQLIQDLASRDASVRLSAQSKLVQMKGSAVVPLIAALKDKSPTIRGSAAELLGKIKDPRATEPLIGALRDPGYWVRVPAVRAIEAMGKAGADRLMKALKDKDARVRESATMGLEEMRCRPAIELIIPLLKDASPSVRQGAATALGNFRDPRAVTPLIAAIKDKDANVGSSVIGALAGIGDPKAIKPLISVLGDNKYYGVEQALQMFGTAAGPPLMEALKSKYPKIRGHSARTLGMICYEPAVEALLASLKDEDHTVRALAASAFW